MRLRRQIFAATGLVFALSCLPINYVGGADDGSTAESHVASTIADQTDIEAKLSISSRDRGWFALSQDDCWNVNCKADTWQWSEEFLRCNGNCVGVLATKKPFKNFEILLDWMHEENAGNSGIFIWSPASSLKGLPVDSLPAGIECQILDHGYTGHYETSTGNDANWFTTDGDIFPVGGSRMSPFAPVSPNGQRSFPSSKHTRGFGQWNQYYLRAINGEVRLWVNGHEVSGGNHCEPADGHLAFECEGSPIKFRNLYLRELP